MNITVNGKTESIEQEMTVAQFLSLKNLKPDTVVVSNPSVPTPAAVRYAWEDYPICNLYNSHGLPAVPFRTSTEPGKE